MDPRAAERLVELCRGRLIRGKHVEAVYSVNGELRSTVIDTTTGAFTTDNGSIFGRDAAGNTTGGRYSGTGIAAGAMKVLELKDQGLRIEPFSGMTPVPIWRWIADHPEQVTVTITPEGNYRAVLPESVRPHHVSTSSYLFSPSGDLISRTTHVKDGGSFTAEFVPSELSPPGMPFAQTLSLPNLDITLVKVTVHNGSKPDLGTLNDVRSKTSEQAAAYLAKRVEAERNSDPSTPVLINGRLVPQVEDHGSVGAPLVWTGVLLVLIVAGVVVVRRMRA